MLTGCWVGTKELDATLLGMEITKGIGHQLILDMTVGVHDEAVVAKSTSLGRT